MASGNPGHTLVNVSAALIHANLSDCTEQKNWISLEEFKRICNNESSGNSDSYTPVKFSGYFMQPHQILALFLSAIAIALNILSLLAIAQIRNRMSTHLRLIISLCLSDLLIAVSLCLHVLNAELNPYTGMGSHSEKLWSMCSFMILKALNDTSLIISLLNLTMMAVDHFMAISRPLHYNVRMRSGKVVCFISLMWLLAAVGGFSDFFTGWNTYYRKRGYNYCEAVWSSLYNDEFVVFFVYCTTLVLMVVIYAIIYQKIRIHQKPGEESTTSKGLRRTTTERRRNKQALVTTLLIVGTFFLCWTPICIYQIGLIIQLHINVKPLQNMRDILIIVDKYLYDLMLLNSIADPIIYAVRMYDVQIGYRRLFHLCKPQLKHNTDITLLPGTRMGCAQSLSGSRRLKADSCLKSPNKPKPWNADSNKSKLIQSDDTSQV